MRLICKTKNHEILWNILSRYSLPNAYMFDGRLILISEEQNFCDSS